MSGRTFKFLYIVLIFAVLELTTAFRILEFFEREPGDELIYLRTKVTIPTVELTYHRLNFDLKDYKQITQVVIEVNEFTEAGVGGLPYSNAYIYHNEFRQLIVTILIYGFNETTSGYSIKYDVIPANWVTVHNSD